MEWRLDDSIAVRYRDRYLTVSECIARPKAAVKPDPFLVGCNGSRSYIVKFTFGIVAMECRRASTTDVYRDKIGRCLPRHIGEPGDIAGAAKTIIRPVHSTSIPAFLRTRLRPPSHPTRYLVCNDRLSDSSTWTPALSCMKPVTSRPR